MAKAVRSLTIVQKAHLNHLAKVLYEFLPLSSNSKNTVTFKTIFTESSVGLYLDGPNNKQQALEKALTKVYRFHQRLPKILIRKIVPAAINYRMYQRKPLTRIEIDDLSNTLYQLGIDMSNELSDALINETLPRIIVPPKQLEERLRKHDIVPKISNEPLQLFSDGHFNESVRKAAEIFEDCVQDKTGIQSSGRDLMANAFKNDHYINTSQIQPENQLGFIEGYKFLSMGTMAAIRNIFSHGNEEKRTPEECFEMLLFINWLFRYIE